MGSGPSLATDWQCVLGRFCPLSVPQCPHLLMKELGQMIPTGPSLFSLGLCAWGLQVTFTWVGVDQLAQ